MKVTLLKAIVPNCIRMGVILLSGILTLVTLEYRSVECHSDGCCYYGCHSDNNVLVLSSVVDKMFILVC